MSKNLNEEVHYYGTIDTSGWNKFQQSWLTNKKIESVIKHKHLGYCAKIYPQEVESIKNKMTISLTVWPDNDCYNFTEEFKLKGIYEERKTLKEI